MYVLAPGDLPRLSPMFCAMHAGISFSPLNRKSSPENKCSDAKWFSSSNLLQDYGFNFLIVSSIIRVLHNGLSRRHLPAMKWLTVS